MIARLAMVGICLTTPAVAALGDDISDTYRGICTMGQTCSATGSCAMTPVMGEMLITVSDQQTMFGRDQADLDPVDHFPTLDDALPLPEIEGTRRSFLVDLPPEGSARQFALHVQLIDAQTGEPILRPRYFVLQCYEAPE